MGLVPLKTKRELHHLSTMEGYSVKMAIHNLGRFLTRYQIHQCFHCALTSLQNCKKLCMAFLPQQSKMNQETCMIYIISHPFKSLKLSSVALWWVAKNHLKIFFFKYFSVGLVFLIIKVSEKLFIASESLSVVSDSL